MFRCQASVIAVSVVIAMMLQRQPRHLEKSGKYNVKNLIDDTYELASQCLDTDDEVYTIHHFYVFIPTLYPQ